MSAPSYPAAHAELWAISNFSFLRGASHPWELVLAAKALGFSAIGIADHNSLAGVVRAWVKGREIGQRVLSGARLDLADGAPSVICYPVDRDAWGRLTRLLTVGQRRAAKANCVLETPDLFSHAQGQQLLVIPPERLDLDFERWLARLAEAFADQVSVLGARRYRADDVRRLHQLDALARETGAPLLAGGDILYHAPERRALQDLITAIRLGTSLDKAGLALEPNAERHLKSSEEMARLFSAWPDALERARLVADRIGFDLSQLRYEYPDEPVPPGKTAISHLQDLAWAGAARRYPAGVPNKVRRHLDQELALIAELDFAPYFLTVHDIVQWARDAGILCQGRGSAANSAVCFCLGVTAVDPTQPDHDILFARFISKAREEPPDIDVDFEHERREEVIQYIYNRYSRHRAAICATVIHYRGRRAIREAGKALGLSEDITAALARTVWSRWGENDPTAHIREAGLDPDNPDIALAVALAAELIGFPRHLSQHVGGFVLTRWRLDETVPIGNAAMRDRTFIEWDKDDIDALGLMKVDVLALGMLSAIAKSLRMLGVQDMADIPSEDPGVYDMLSAADSVGVFQVESRAQMSMLPRLKPQKFYDLVIEVAIVRPGPIQGDMVHPYLRRRSGQERVSFPAPAAEHGPPDELKAILGKTLGVPLFQEQAMRLAMEAALFTPEEANGLRRAMATFKNDGDLSLYRDKFIGGMTRRGYDLDFANRCFRQIEGFGSYGFPESHAVSFAKLVYVSAWIKRRRPDVFCVAMLNSQPLGFYQPAQLIRDARAHGVEIRPVDVMKSDWDCKLETPLNPGAGQAVRLGFRQIKGLVSAEAQKLITAREAGATDLADLARRSGVSRMFWESLAEADALGSHALSRRQALWAVKVLEAERPPLLDLMGAPPEGAPSLRPMKLPAEVAEDYRTLGLSLKGHPCAFFRRELELMGVVTSLDLERLADGAHVAACGLVLIRQRPGTANGVVFLTLEDETGATNSVVWPGVFAAHRRTVMSSRLLVVRGRLQKASGVTHIVAEAFVDLTSRLSELWGSRRQEGFSPKTPRLQHSRDFH